MMGSLPERQHLRAHSVCIIGAGPGGVAAAKYLLAERAFDKIKVYEQRTTLGGLWNYNLLPHPELDCPIPQVDPHSAQDEPVWQSYGDGTDTSKGSTPSGAAHFSSPIYDRLETNIPRGLMGFKDLDWPEETQLFPKHPDVLQYIRDYGESVKHLVQFSTQVVNVRRERNGGWKVWTRWVGSSSSDDSNPRIEDSVEDFDAVLVATGHFAIPYVPKVEGISDYAAAHPGSILHSKYYRNAESYAGRKVIVVGNSASGIDIGAQIASVAQLPVIHSIRGESWLQPDSSPARLDRPHITKFVPEGRRVLFADGSEEANVDAVIYCTGYFYSYPFLRSLQTEHDPLITTGEFVRNLYQHIFYRPDPTLAFVLLNQKIIPFSTAEGQASVVSRVWSGRLSLPSESEMEEWEGFWLQKVREEAEENGKGAEGWGRLFHVLKYPKDAHYINMLHDWAMAADVASDSRLERSNCDGQEAGRDAIGKEPPLWDEEAFWTRERFQAIKKAFASRGEARHGIRALKELGFDYEQWTREKAEEAKHLL